ncbi:MAG TPA: septal ring lytic transglycosylase RlpA family protein [Burkholderiales bacterium]|nr:septal ring lytic transglycosylase RlpA family protein [Burkholderiales bacterium]
MRTKNARNFELTVGARCRIAVAAAVASALLSACGSTPVQREPGAERAHPTRPPARISKAPSGPRTTRGGGYYLDDGPGDNPPADLDSIPDAVPQLEPLSRGTMKPYVVLGQTFTPMTELQPYKARGVATWYGRRYHGQKTSNGETYDMYQMTAAHPILPIPSYARVTNVANGKSVVVRINDRGPFLENRLIDLSYTAAYRIGVLAGGSAVVEVESILPDASGPSATMIAAAPAARPRYAAARVAPTPQALAPVATASTPPVPIAAPVATASELAERSDPIVAIAAAARDPLPPPKPLAEVPVESAPAIVATAPARIEPPIAAPRPAPVAEAPGVYLQLGAFGSKENAESFLATAKARAEWVSQMAHVYPRDGMYRVHVGPYASQSEARLAAERIAFALGTRPVVVTR